MELDLTTLIIYGILTGFLGGLLANCIELPVIAYMTRPERLLKRFANPSEKDLELLRKLFMNFVKFAGEKDNKLLRETFTKLLDFFTEKSIPTGEKLKAELRPAVVDDKGNIITPAQYKYIDEVVSPLDLMVERMSADTLNRLQGWFGSMKREGMKAAKNGSWEDVLLGWAERSVLPKLEDSMTQRLNMLLTPKPPA